MRFHFSFIYFVLQFLGIFWIVLYNLFVIFALSIDSRLSFRLLCLAIAMNSLFSSSWMWFVAVIVDYARYRMFRCFCFSDNLTTHALTQTRVSRYANKHNRSERENVKKTASIILFVYNCMYSLSTTIRWQRERTTQRNDALWLEKWEIIERKWIICCVLKCNSETCVNGNAAVVAKTYTTDLKLYTQQTSEKKKKWKNTISTQQNAG